MTTPTSAPPLAEGLERDRETLGYPMHCTDGFTKPWAPCGAEAEFISIGRDTAANTLAYCSDCLPEPCYTARTFRMADATLAQLMQATSLIIEHRVCPPPDPEWPTPYQERLHQAGLVVRSELERRLDELAIQ